MSEKKQAPDDQLMCNPQRYLKGEMSTDEQLEFFEHVERCAECMRTLQAVRRNPANYKPAKMRLVSEKELRKWA